MYYRILYNRAEKAKTLTKPDVLSTSGACVIQLDVLIKVLFSIPHLKQVPENIVHSYLALTVSPLCKCFNTYLTSAGIVESATLPLAISAEILCPKISNWWSLWTAISAAFSSLNLKIICKRFKNYETFLAFQQFDFFCRLLVICFKTPKITKPKYSARKSLLYTLIK